MKLTWLDRVTGNPATLPLRDLILNLVAFIALSTQVIFAVIDTLLVFSWLRFSFNLIMMPLFALLYWAVRFRGSYRLAKRFALVVALLFEATNFFGNGGSDGSTWVITMAVLGIFAIIYEAKPALIYGALAAGLLLVCLGVEAAHPEWINPYHSPIEKVLDLLSSFFFCGGMLFVLVLLVMHYYGESNERTRKALAVSAQTEKLAALGEAMASLNHEVSNPLGVMDLALSNAATWWARDFSQVPRLWSLIPAGQEGVFWSFLYQGYAASPDPETRRARGRSFESHFQTLGWSDPASGGQLADYFPGAWDPAWNALFAGPEREELLAAVIRFLDMAHSYLAVNSAHRRLMNLVTSLSSYSRQEAQTGPGAVRIDESLDLVVALFVGHRNKTVQVVRRYEAVPTVIGHTDELIQVWTNLVKNALSAMGDRGVLTLSLAHDSQDVTVTIDDSGPGVPEELHERIFESFFTTKGPGKGTGLGLAIVKRIVTEHKGTIALSRSPAGGARFVVRLPVAS